MVNATNRLQNESFNTLKFITIEQLRNLFLPVIEARAFVRQSIFLFYLFIYFSVEPLLSASVTSLLLISKLLCVCCYLITDDL